MSILVLCYSLTCNKEPVEYELDSIKSKNE